MHTHTDSQRELLEKNIVSFHPASPRTPRETESCWSFHYFMQQCLILKYVQMEDAAHCSHKPYFLSWFPPVSWGVLLRFFYMPGGGANVTVFHLMLKNKHHSVKWTTRYPVCWSSFGFFQRLLHTKTRRYEDKYHTSLYSNKKIIELYTCRFQMLA